MAKIKFILFTALLFLSLACSEKKASKSNGYYKRIASLSPSITKNIIDLGLEDRLVGVTSYHPPLKKDVKIVGTLNRPNIELIVRLKPDIVLFSEEDSVTQRVEAFKRLAINYYKFNRNDGFSSILKNYKILGNLLGRKKFAENKILKFSNDHNKLIKLDRLKDNRIAFFVSSKPLITVSNKSFIGSIIRDCGLENIYDNLKQPYPLVTPESLLISDPNIILLMANMKTEYGKGAKERLQSLLKDSKGNLFVISPQNVAYYTPMDYLFAIKQINKILHKNGLSN